MNYNSNQYQESGISLSEKQNCIFQQSQRNPSIDSDNNNNNQSFGCVELKLTKLSNSSISKFKSYDIYDTEDQILNDMTDSNCGSPDTRMESLIARISDTELKLYNLNDETEQDTLKINLINTIAQQDGFMGSDSQQRKLLKQSLALQQTQFTSKESGLEQYSNDIGISPFNFEQSQRFSGKSDNMERKKFQKLFSSNNPSFKLLDKVLEEEIGIQGRLNSDLTDESQNQLKVQGSNGQTNQEEDQQTHEILHRFSPIFNKKDYFYSNSSNDVFFNGQSKQQLIQPNSQDQYAEMQKRIFNFFDDEKIFPLAVGEAIREINCSLIKGTSKLSPLKLDITRSPLRRLRANTIQL